MTYWCIFRILPHEYCIPASLNHMFDRLISLTYPFCLPFAISDLVFLLLSCHNQIGYLNILSTVTSLIENAHNNNTVVI